MVGSVLGQELLIGGRRGWQHVFRWLFAGWLVLQFGSLYLMGPLSERNLARNGFVTGGHGPDYGATGRFVDSYLETLVTQQLILLMLVTPAFVAGSITEEKSRGTLLYLLTTELSSWEIVSGRLLGRMAQVLILALTVVPFLAFVGGMGGVGVPRLAACFVISLVPVFPFGAAAMLASVWCRHTRDAVLALYASAALALVMIASSAGLERHLVMTGAITGSMATVVQLLGTLNGFLAAFDPVPPLRSVVHGSTSRVPVDFVAYVFVWAGLAALLLFLSVWRLRGSYLRQLERAGRQRKPRWYRARRAAVSDEPLRWKERHVEGIAPLAFLKNIPTWLALTGIVALTLTVEILIVLAHLRPQYSAGGLFEMIRAGDWEGLNAARRTLEPVGGAFIVQNIYVLLIATFVVGVRCSGTINGEREKQTWDVLLLTPLETRELIRSKLAGIMGAASPYLLAYYTVAGLSAAVLGSPLAVFSVIAGTAFTWVAMLFVGAAGIWCSVRNQSSWRSLFFTLGIGYVGGTLVSCFSGPLMLIVAWGVWLLLLLVCTLLDVDKTLLTGSGSTMVYVLVFQLSSIIVLTGLSILLSIYFLKDAEKWVADRERVRDRFRKR